MTENNNRWWEFLLPRYLAGTMFAVLVLFYLVAFHGNEIQKRLCQSGSNETLCECNFSNEVYSRYYVATAQTKQKQLVT